MVETVTADKTYEFVGKVENIQTSTAEVVKTLPIDSEVKTTILLNIEDNIKQVLYNLAEKNEIWLDYRDKDGETQLGWGANTNPEEFKHLPNSITGVIIYYVIKGIKEDFGYEFETEPKSLKQRGLSKDAKKIAGKKRLLTREQKNELLERTQMSFYDKKISSGEMTVDSAMNEIREAYGRKQSFEEMGYMLPSKKTEYPYWVEEVAV